MIRKALLFMILLPSIALGLALLAGYLGALHPIGDSFALFRPHVAMALMLAGAVLALLQAWRAAGLSLLLALVAGLPVMGLALPPRGPDASPQLTVYAKNLLFGRGDTPALLADIRASGADVILLQELNSEGGFVLSALSDSHPHRHICQFSPRSGIAVLSRWPLSDPHCSVHRTLAAARVATTEGPVWAVSTHLQWPYPASQRHALDHEMDFLRSLEGHVVIGGDFNMAPWGRSVRDMARATGAALLEPIHVTIRPRGVPLSIDHVLTTGTGITVRRPRLGSDHYGLVARIHLAAETRLFSQR